MKASDLDTCAQCLRRDFPAKALAALALVDWLECNEPDIYEEQVPGKDGRTRFRVTWYGRPGTPGGLVAPTILGAIRKAMKAMPHPASKVEHLKMMLARKPTPNG